MNVNRGIWFTMALAMVAASAALAQEAKTDYDRNADFSQYKTYSWKNVHAQNQLWVDRIEEAVNSALAAKGLTQVQSGGDICIMAMEMNEEHRTLNTYYDNFGGGWHWGGGFGTATTTEDTYTVGTLVVDLFDANTKMLVWRGSASGTLSSKSGRNIKKLDKGVQKMFEHFPPESAGRTKPLL